MAPSNLQGLNVVHPIPPQNPFLSDADLLSVPHFPDLNAQLDLWTNLNFQSDEPLVPPRRGEGIKKSFDEKRGAHDDSSEDDPDRYNDPDESSGIAEAHSHENVVMGTVLPPTGIAHSVHTSSASAHLPPFDINSLLAGFGIDPFMGPPQPAAQSPSTIAQLLSLHAASTLRPATTASTTSTPAAQSPPQQSQAAISSTTTTTKRARTSRSSVSSAVAPESPQQMDSPEDKSSSTPPQHATEDKRRRNTAASARFRLKKKEREAALERKAKELELRVGELEKECEALRRENGWLKGLVVGVTGAGAVQQQQLQQQQQIAPAASTENSGRKRLREDDV